MTTTVEAVLDVVIDRPCQDVWRFVADLERAPEWLGEFVAASNTSGGPFGLGSVVSYTIDPGHRTGTFEIVEWEPERRLAWDGPPLRSMGGAVRPRGSFEVETTPDGQTRLITTFRPELIGTLVLLRPYMARWLRRQRRDDLLRLKATLEGEDGVNGL